MASFCNSNLITCRVTMVVKRCIFCKSEENLGHAVEHIFPESLGNTQKLLPAEAVCLKCNNGFLSRLDQAFMEFEPIATIKAYLQIPSKKNKLKDLHLGDTKINNSKAGHIGIELARNDQYERGEISHDGWERFKLHSTGKKRLTAGMGKMVARALLKQAFECMYLDKGYEYLLSDEHDALREAVVSGRNFGGRLVIGNSSTINPKQCKFQYQFVAKDGAKYLFVHGSYFGVEMATTFPGCNTAPQQSEMVSILPFTETD